MNNRIIIKQEKNWLTTCYFSTKHSSLVCSLKAEQKGESDEPVEVLYNIEDSLDLKEMIRKSIIYSILETNCTIKFTITFHIVQDGFDVFSCAINAFTCCAIVSGINLKDTLTSYSDGICNVIYMLHKQKICGFYIEGNLEKKECLQRITKCIEECKSTGVRIKKSIIAHIKSN